MGRLITKRAFALLLLSAGWALIAPLTPTMAQFPPLQPLPSEEPSVSPDPADSLEPDLPESESPEVEAPEPEASPLQPVLPSTVTPRPAPLPPPIAVPRPFPQSAVTIFENVTLAPAFAPDPTTVRGISGGAVPANELAGRAETITGACSGFIDQQPDHQMVLTQFFNYLSLQIQSTANTTLVVRGPGGTWCNDDYSGKNPGIAGQWLSGTYDIWIGSYDQNTYHPYIIEMTEQQ